MRKIMAVSAVILMVGGIAYASDGNTVYVDQNGERNSAEISQNGGGNQFGRGLDPVVQYGKRNRIDAKQAGSRNRAGSSGAGLLGFEPGDRGIDQTGSGNRFRLRQNGDRNRIETVQQTGHALGAGKSDVLGVDQEGHDRIGMLIQKNDVIARNPAEQNKATIDQHGSGNTIAAVRQVGHSNTLVISQANGAGNFIGVADQGLLGAADHNAAGTIKLAQDGSRNTIFAAAQVGHDNKMRIAQQGDANTVFAASQIGVSNDMALELNGDGNSLGASQWGSHNSVRVKVTADRSDGSSDGNSADISQEGDFNVVKLDIRGDGNGLGSFSGAAAAVGLDAGAISQGSLLGTGADNRISLQIDDETGSGLGGRANLFAFAQKGSDNTIEGRQFGNSNQAAVSQVGRGNGTYFSQVGPSNVIGVKQ